MLVAKFMLVPIVLLFWGYLYFSSNSQKQEGYKNVASAYETDARNIGFDTSASSFLVPGIHFPGEQIQEIWDMVDISTPARLNHPMAYHLGILWRRVGDSDIAWYRLAIDRGNQYVIVFEYGETSRTSKALYDYLIQFER